MTPHTFRTKGAALRPLFRCKNQDIKKSGSEYSLPPANHYSLLTTHGIQCFSTAAAFDGPFILIAVANSIQKTR